MGCRESILLSSQQSSDSQVTTIQHFSVCFQNNTVTQIVQHQRLMCLCKPQLPRLPAWRSALRGCTCTAVITADKDNIGTTFGYARRNRSNANFGYQLNVDFSRGLAFLVIDQLSQILNRVDIMMRWRRDQTYTRCRSANLNNPRVYLVQAAVHLHPVLLPVPS